ncbi:MAG TPA: hypothetical protein VHZ07_20735 [Bryobacteraceae bacterium]|jgi:hypothetical protein|nr:hypothetical protein [Bryobacteraceae bacterium]
MLLAIVAIAMPLAHVVELPNKLALDGALWLAVQQHLYRGWGPFFGGPVEIGALITSLLFIYIARQDLRTRLLMIAASLAYIGMIAAFFMLNRSVNEAVAIWTASTIPPYWREARMRWESGHCIAFVFSLIGAWSVLRGHFYIALRPQPH